jgi:hypothetical protein
VLVLTRGAARATDIPAETYVVGYSPQERQKPAIAGFEASGRSRIRTWDLFLIREAL